LFFEKEKIKKEIDLTPLELCTFLYLYFSFLTADGHFLLKMPYVPCQKSKISEHTKNIFAFLLLRRSHPSAHLRQEKYFFLNLHNF